MNIFRKIKNLDEFSNFIFMLSSTVLGKLISFFSIAIIARKVSVDSKGVYDYFNVIVSYFILILNMGYELYFINLVLNDNENPNRLFTIQIKSRFLLAVLFLVFEIVFLVFTKKITENSLVLIILSIKMLTYSFDITWYYKSNKRFKMLSILEILNSLIKLIFIILMINNIRNVIYIALIDVICDIIIKLIANHKAGLKILRDVSYRLVFNVIKKSFVINISSFMIAIYYNVDALLIGVFATKHDVAIYTAAYTLLVLCIIPTGILYQIYTPILTKSRNNSKILKKYSMTTAFLGILVFVFMIIFKNIIVDIVFGKNYFESKKVLSFLIIDIIPCYLAGAFANPINTWGYYKDYLRIVTIGCFFNIVGNLILIPHYGINGAVFTTIMSECIVFVQALMWHRKRINKNTLEEI